MQNPHYSPFRAILYALAGFTCWVIGDTFMKLAEEYYVPSYEIMVIAAIGGLISIFSVTAARGKLTTLQPKKYAGLCFLGFLFMINYVVWLKALIYLPLANFYTVLFLSPTVVAILAVRFLKERLNWRKAVAILVGFIGTTIAINPSSLSYDPDARVGYIAAFLGMLVIAIQQLTLRMMSQQESRESMAFYPRFGSLLGGLIGGFLYGFAPLSGIALAYCILTGFVGGIGWIFIAHAYKLANAATVSPFHYSQIITGALFGYLIWHNIPSTHLLIGAALIVLSGIYIVRHTRAAAETTDVA